MQYTLPPFVPLALTFDREALLTEALALLPLCVHQTVEYHGGQSSFYAQGGPLVDAIGREKLGRVSRYEPDGSGNRSLRETELGAFRVCNLTWIPGFESSKQTIAHEYNGRKQLFIHTHPIPWSWRTDIEVPRIRDFVESLGFEFIQMVRLVAMVPPAIGVIHSDSGPRGAEDYYSSGFASLTLNLAEGGGKLLFDHDGVVRECSGDAWHFNDALPHGVTEISSTRAQLRIWGKMAPAKYRSYFKEISLAQERA